MHLLCYSRELKESHIGTTVQTLDNLFPYLKTFFGFEIERVVETRKEIINKNCIVQLDLFSVDTNPNMGYY